MGSFPSVIDVNRGRMLAEDEVMRMNTPESRDGEVINKAIASNSKEDFKAAMMTDTIKNKVMSLCSLICFAVGPGTNTIEGTKQLVYEMSNKVADEPTFELMLEFLTQVKYVEVNDSTIKCTPKGVELAMMFLRKEVPSILRYAILKGGL